MICLEITRVAARIDGFFNSVTAAAAWDWEELGVSLEEKGAWSDAV